MKEKCQCVPPKDTLNYRAADRHCERCGVALCGDCGSVEAWRTDKWREGFVCRTCAELEE